MNDLLMIGQFAVVAGISKRMLRHYDKLGLICPDQIDEENNYRYYNPDQLPLIRTITMLQAYGFSLSEIKTMMTHQMSVEFFVNTLKDKEIHLRQSIDEQVGHLLNIQQTITYLENNTKPGLINLRQLNLERSHTMTEQNKSDIQIEVIKSRLNALPNTSLFMETLEERIKSNSSSEKYFITFDLDHFAPVNDLYGFDVGDQIIYKSFEIMLNAFQPMLDDGNAIASRYGGDEVSFFINDVSIDRVLAAVDHILHTIRTYDFNKLGCEKSLTSSCGIYSFKTCDHTQEVRHESAKAFMEAKRKGGDQYVHVRKDR